MLIRRHFVIVGLDQRRDGLLNRTHFYQSHFRVLEKLKLNYLSVRPEQSGYNFLCSSVRDVAQVKHVARLIDVLVVLTALLSESM